MWLGRVVAVRQATKAVPIGLAVVLTLLGGIASTVDDAAAAPTASGSDGVVSITGAWAPLPSDPQLPAVYLTVRNAGPQPVQLEDVTALDAASAFWVLSGHLHTAEDIANAAECARLSADVAASARQLATSSDLIVAAHGSLTLTPGVGRIEVERPRVPFGAGARVGLVFSFSSFTDASRNWTVRVGVPVRATRVKDSLTGPPV